EAKPCVLEWTTNEELDCVIGEHYGYSVIHRRSVTFYKRDRWWLIEDEFFGEGEHVYEARFHFAPEVKVKVGDRGVEAWAGDVGLRVVTDLEAVLERQPVSRDYGQISDAVSACWKISGRVSKLR